MSDPIEWPKILRISFNDSFQESADLILRAYFPTNTDWSKGQVTAMAGLMHELVEEIWPQIRMILQRAGVDERWVEDARRSLILTAWNQVCTDLFGSHIRVAFEREKA